MLDLARAVRPERRSVERLARLPGRLALAVRSAEQLLDLHDDVVARAEPDSVDRDRDEGWEYLLLASELEGGFATLDRQWRDHDVGFVQPTGERITEPSAAIADLGARADEITAADGSACPAAAERSRTAAG